MRVFSLLYSRLVKSLRVLIVHPGHVTIYLHRRKIGIASNLRIVKTAVHVYMRTFVHVLYYKVHKCEACVNRYSCFHHRACSSTKVNF